jgi:Zn-dependent protease
MVLRTEADIEVEIEQIRQQARDAGRELSEAEREQIDHLIFERAAAYRAQDAQRRSEYVRQQRDHWRPLERAKLRAAIRPSPIFIALLVATGVSGFLLATSPSERMVRPLTIAFLLSAWIAQVCIHEFGHALAGYLGGDRGVAARGSLSLDPRRYTNPLLSIALPVVFLLLGGIGLPGGSVYIERRSLRSRQWDLLVSAGGPLGTLLCLLLAGSVFLIGGERWISEGNIYFWAALAAFVKLLAVVLILNLLPIPPLDGFNILSYWLPDEIRQRAYALGWMPLMLLYFVLGRPGPVSEAFWRMGDSLSGLFNLPYGYAESALSLLQLR